MSKIASKTIHGAEALDLAIQKAGGITKMARALGLSGHSVVDQWRRNGVPAEWCPRVEELTGVPSEALRPSTRWDVLRNRPLPDEATWRTRAPAPGVAVAPMASAAAGA